MVQWLGLLASTEGGTGSIPGRGTKIPPVVQHGQKTSKQIKKTNKIVSTILDPLHFHIN